MSFGSTGFSAARIEATMPDDPARRLADADRAYTTAIQCGEADAAAVAWSDVCHWTRVIAGAEPELQP